MLVNTAAVLIYLKKLGSVYLHSIFKGKISNQFLGNSLYQMKRLVEFTHINKLPGTVMSSLISTEVPLLMVTSVKFSVSSLSDNFLK